jgi:hypothetical protein
MSSATSSSARNLELPPVDEACEALWLVENSKQALDWIKVIYASLQERRPLDPTQVFLALQGASSRFHSETELQRKIFLTVAALARVAVGPAWWHQIKQRRERFMVENASSASANGIYNNSSNRTFDKTPDVTKDKPPNVVLLNVAERSCSPLAKEIPHQHPSIPEILAAAMIRFAASMNDSMSQSIIQAQVALVTALCLSPDTTNEATDGWAEAAAASELNIPGIQRDLGSMVMSWLTCHELKLRFNLLKATNDLLAAGWGPHADISPALMEVLLQIAMESLEPDGQERNHREQRKLLCTALSCAAESLSILTSIGSRGLIPSECIANLVDNLSRLHVQVLTLRKTTPLIFPVFVETIEESLELPQQLASFQSHQESCLADIADLIWFLLAQEASSLDTMNTLLRIVHAANFASAECSLPRDSNKWSDANSIACQRAGAATFIISNSLWGSSQDHMALGFLRVHWNSFLNVVFESLTESYPVVDALNVPTIVKDICCVQTELLHVLGRAVENEVRNEVEKLSEIDWELIVKGLDKVIPWLSLERTECLDAQLAAQSLIQSLCTCLEYWHRFETVPFADCSIQKQLYFILLQVVSPKLASDEARRLGLATARVYAKFMLFPYSLGNWTAAASCLLEEAFRKNDEGVHVHMACIRLEALKVLTCNPVDDMDSDSDVAPMSPDDRPPSLLVVTQHTREQHLDFITSCIIPKLKDSLWESSSDMSASDLNSVAHLSVLYPVEIGNFSPVRFAEVFAAVVEGSNNSVIEQSNLSLYAVRLVGRL